LNQQNTNLNKTINSLSANTPDVFSKNQLSIIISILEVATKKKNKRENKKQGRVKLDNTRSCQLTEKS
jgi:hypothetical protein